MSQRFEGRNLDEALGHAAEALAVERHQLTYHVLLEKRGFLGGVKRIVIEAEVNAAATAPPPPPPPAASAPAYGGGESRPPMPAGRSARGGGGGGGRDRDRGRGGRGRGGNRSEDRGGRDRGRGRSSSRRREDDLQVGDFERFANEVITEAPEQGAESDVAKVVRDWCEEVLRLAKLDADIRTEENETQVLVRLYGRDARRFLDNNGELLDAVQVLANKTLTGRKIEKEIELDCEAFKKSRENELGQQAREIADRVRRDGREQLLPAMSPIERRIVHVTLQDDPEVTTESRGEGFFKRVAIVPRSEATAAE